MFVINIKGWKQCKCSWIRKGFNKLWHILYYTLVSKNEEALVELGGKTTKLQCWREKQCVDKEGNLSLFMEEKRKYIQEVLVFEETRKIHRGPT